MCALRSIDWPLATGQWLGRGESWRVLLLDSCGEPVPEQGPRCQGQRSFFVLVRSTYVAYVGSPR